MVEEKSDKRQRPQPESNPRMQQPTQGQPNWPEALVQWFEAHARDLPWRRNHDPYRVWLSEVMLQQTQVDRVALYFERWLHLFPNIEAVAEAPIETILSVWQGLGYYSRARNFHRAARIVVDQFEGRVPDRFEDLISLPGVGRYTAGAILAFAYNQPYPTIEANTERVYARITDEAGNLKQRAVYRLMEERLASWIPQGKARLFNQGIMELGSLVCTPKSPRCTECPIAEQCLARQRGTVEQRPVLPPKKSRIKVRSLALVALRRDGSILLFQRPQSGLWAGFWELPDKAMSQEFAEQDQRADDEQAKGGRQRTKAGRSDGTDRTKSGPAPRGQARREPTEQVLTALLKDLSPLLIQDLGAETDINVTAEENQDPNRKLTPDRIPDREQKQATAPGLLHLGKVSHSYTRYSATVDCYLLDLTPSPSAKTDLAPHLENAGDGAGANGVPSSSSDRKARTASRPHRWVALDEVEELPLHAGHRKCLALVRHWIESQSFG